MSDIDQGEFMNHRYARVALCATASMQFLLAGQAWAQADDAAVDESIIVTARRVEERLQDVPISITVASQERLTKANVSSSDDLARVVPGLNVQTRYSSEQSNFSIRGFSQELRTSASVGTYFADVVAPRGGGVSLQGGDGAGPGQLFDLQNVQVLKGPQGTLFGRNTTGGAVLLTPKKPTDKFEGYLEGSYGNYEMLRIQGAVNLPISDTIRLRLGVDRTARDGYLKNVSGIGPKDFADVDYIALRGSLVIDVTPDIENYTIVSYSKSDNNGLAQQAFRANTGINPATGRPYGLGRAVSPQVARLNASGDPYQIEQKLTNPRSLTRQFQVINNTSFRLSDDITIRNIASFSRLIQDLRQDIFGTNIPAPSAQIPNGYISSAFSFNPEGLHTNDQENWTEELQLQGTGADGKLNYQAGLYYERSGPGGLTGSLTPAVGAACRISGYTTLSNLECTSLDPTRLSGTTPSIGWIKFINMAAYAQATYALTDQFKITGGLRYTYDRSHGWAQTLQGTFPAGVVGPAVILPPGTPGRCAAGYSLATDCVFEAKTSTKRPTWTINLQYNPTPDAMVYATYSRGYRQGAVTPFVAAGSPIFGPEKVDNFEAGAKLSFSGAVSGNFNIAGFYSKLANQQIQVGLQNSTDGNTATSIFNAGKSRIYGFDVEGSLRFASFFRVDGSATYVNSLLQSLVLPATFPGYDVVLPSAIAGDELAFTPKWGINISPTVTLPFDDSVGKVELTATYRYNSSYSNSASNLYIPSVGSNRSTAVSQLDLNFDWRDIGGQPIDFAIFATNVTNQFTTTLVQPLYNSFGFDTRVIGRPRMYGARIRVRFGD
jgi:iron complex outermembrane receptor protein